MVAARATGPARVKEARSRPAGAVEPGRGCSAAATPVMEVATHCSARWRLATGPSGSATGPSALPPAGLNAADLRRRSPRPPPRPRPGRRQRSRAARLPSARTGGFERRRSSPGRAASVAAQTSGHPKQSPSPPAAQGVMARTFSTLPRAASTTNGRSCSPVGLPGVTLGNSSYSNATTVSAHVAPPGLIQAPSNARLAPTVHLRVPSPSGRPTAGLFTRTYIA